MHQQFLTGLAKQLSDLKDLGLFKEERVIASPQEAYISLANGQKVLNLCANNYLGLANDPRLIKAAQEGYSQYGFGLASVRFICGTQSIHKQLEERLSMFLGTEDTILYSSCFDANGGLFEPLLSQEDLVISDALNHASIIDGIRLCKAERLVYQNNDMEDLEKQLQRARHARYRLIATDGVFSMDGSMANLRQICALADKYQALTMVDDCHAVGIMGSVGRGTPECCDVIGKIDILTGTFGKALGGASGGYASGRKEIIAWLRQRSRPYLFSNTLAPSIAAATLGALDILSEGNELRQKLHENSLYFRQKLAALGFSLAPGSHPIIPVMLGDERLAQQFAAKLLERGIYVIGFSYPVVPKGKARIRTQMSAAHTFKDLDLALRAFEEVGRELGVLKN